MMTNKKTLLIVLLGLIFIGFGAYYLAYVKSSQSPSDMAQKPDVTEAPKNVTNNPIRGIIVETGKVVPSKTTPEVTIQIPNLDRPVVIPASSLSQKDDLTERMKTTVGLLKQDPTLFNEWNELGLLRKTIEDYTGAKEAWEYASVIRPHNSLSFGNLAVLYGYYLGKPVLAEHNYLKSIENDPKLPYLYIQASDFYQEVLKSPEKARAILEKGIQEIPLDEALKAALGSIKV